MRGAECAGIDASHRLVDIARDRNPGSDIRVGDMCDLPWEDESFDLATSFRGIWGTTPAALADVRRVLRPGGRVAMTVWGDVGKSPGAWMFLPFRWALEAQVDNQAQMVSLGRPGVGEAFFADGGFAPEERFVVPFFIEWADPDAYARGLASSGPAYEAIQTHRRSGVPSSAPPPSPWNTSVRGCRFEARSNCSATSASRCSRARIEVVRQVLREVGCVVACSVDEARLSSAKEGRADQVHTG